MKNQKGITLIALIITIIVMVILAGVVISTALLDGGVLQQSREAKKEHEAGQETEKVRLAVTSAALAGLDVITEENLVKALDESFERERYSLNNKEEYFELTITDLETKFKIYPNGKIEETKIATGVTDEQGEYYLRLINVAYEFIEATDEEVDKAQEEMWDLMDSGREFELASETEMCFIIDDYYYYISADNFELKLLDKNSVEYKKYNEIFNELKDVEKKLNTLLSGYTYTEANYSREEFKNYIENNIGKTILDFSDKDFEIDSIEIKSSIDETILLFYSTEITKEGSTYKIENIKNGNQGGF